MFNVVFLKPMLFNGSRSYRLHTALFESSNGCSPLCIEFQTVPYSDRDPLGLVWHLWLPACLQQPVRKQMGWTQLTFHFLETTKKSDLTPNQPPLRPQTQRLNQVNFRAIDILIS